MNLLKKLCEDFRIRKMKEASEYCIVYITAPDKSVAENIAETLLRKRLIACANICDNVSSMYWWEGEIEKDKEVVIICKSLKDKLGSIEEEVKKMHPYTVPCIISFAMFKGNQDFLSWISAQLTEESN